jgi:phospholipid/cholesterol/gamma-HCH transport system substrate-binding protein
MLTRFVRIQLIIFTIASVIGVIAMGLAYMQVPTLLGIGRMTVTLELPATGGLYPFSNVTYRGVQVGKVTAVVLTQSGAKATLSLASSVKVPADLRAEVRSVSAIGEQYVDLRPRSDAPPYLHNGSVIAMGDATIPQPIGPMLDKTSALINSIPKGKLSTLLDESFNAFNGADYDFESLYDSSAKISGDLNGIADRAQTLTEDTGPLLDSQAGTADSIRLWVRSLVGFTGQLSDNDPRVRTLLNNGPGALDEASRLLEQLKPTLPVLLANLTTIGQIGITYHASLEQVLVLLPAFTAAVQSFLGTKSPTGKATGAFNLVISDPPACTVGFLPPSQWRSPADETVIDTPDGLYCKLPQDSPIGVRGAQLLLHGSSREACANGRNLQQRQAVRTAGNETARVRHLPDRPQPALPGHPARRSDQFQPRADLRAGGRDAAASGSRWAGVARRTGTGRFPGCTTIAVASLARCSGAGGPGGATATGGIPRRTGADGGGPAHCADRRWIAGNRFGRQPTLGGAERVRAHRI